MPIDPSILTNIQPIKIEDPMTRYSNYLAMQSAMNQNDEYQNKVAVQNALNASWDPAKGTFDYNKLAQGGGASHIPTLQKSQREAEKAGYDALKAESELVGEEMKRSRFGLETIGDPLKVKTPQEYNRIVSDYIAWHEGNHKNPILGKWLSINGFTAEASRAKILEAAKNPQEFAYLLGQSKAGLENMMRNRVTLMENGQNIEMVTTNEFGNPEPKVIRTTKSAPKAPQVVIKNDLKGEGAGAVKWGELEAQSLHELKKVALSAPQIARDADRALAILEDDKAFTGRFANAQLGMASILKAMGVPVEGVSDTQELAALLAKKTLSAIQTSGVGARGMDTPKEREFLEKAENGQITLDRDTLITAAKVMRKAANNTIENYNEQAKYAPESWFKATGGRRILPLLTERKTTPATPTPSIRTQVIPQAHADYLKAHPETRGDFEKKYGKAAADKILGKSGGKR